MEFIADVVCDIFLSEEISNDDADKILVVVRRKCTQKFLNVVLKVIAQPRRINNVYTHYARRHVGRLDVLG